MDSVALQVDDRVFQFPTPSPDLASAAGVTQLVLDAHRREGFDAGYRRAINHVLAVSIFAAEQSLAPASAEERRAVYRFIATLEQEVIRFRDRDEVSDGLGI